MAHDSAGDVSDDTVIKYASACITGITALPTQYRKVPSTIDQSLMQD